MVLVISLADNLPFPKNRNIIVNGDENYAFDKMIVNLKSLLQGENSELKKDKDIE